MRSVCGREERSKKGIVEVKSSSGFEYKSSNSYSALGGLIKLLKGSSVNRMLVSLVGGRFED